jgi:hypothetical protein
MSVRSELARRIAMANVDVAIAAEQVREATERLRRAAGELEHLEQEVRSCGTVGDPGETEAEATTTPIPRGTSGAEEAVSRISTQEPRDASSDRLTIVHGPHAGSTVVEDEPDDLDWLGSPEDDPRTVLRELANSSS